MYTILYLHGFLSSPKSHKAQVTKRWLAQHRPDVEYLCPALSSYPSECIEQIREALSCINTPIGVIGSSLGGFWATNIIEQQLADAAVLVNPAVSPHTRIDEFMGKELHTYSGPANTYTLTEKDLHDFASMDTLSISRPDQYWLMVQTGDETLNYRLAADKYRHSQQLIEQGGNHAFDTYKDKLPAILKFFDQKLIANHTNK